MWARIAKNAIILHHPNLAFYVTHTYTCAPSTAGQTLELRQGFGKFAKPNKKMAA